MNSTPSSIKDFTLIPMNSIKIGSRFRKDLGDIASLAENIKEIGLLHPIVINQNQGLICGLRRIEAFKSLGKSEVPAHIVNLDDIVKGEISENTQRKNFSLEEVIQIKKAVEPEIKTESKKRKLSGKPSAKFAEGSNKSNNNNITSKNYSENQTRAQVAKYVSLYGKEISHTTLAKAEKVYDAAQQDPATFGQIWAGLNSGKISPDKAYRDMQGIQTPRNETVEPKSPTTKGTERNRELSDKTSQIAKPSDELRHIKQKQAAADKDKHLNLVAGVVTKTGDFELAFLLGEMKYYLASLYSKVGDGGKVWISGKFDKATGNLLSIKFGRISGYSDV
jgi:ParB family transcriptional regulator, chromosome partitioning protein